MFPPRLCRSSGVRCFRVTQRPGDLIVTYPAAYHAGFSLGLNMAEAMNFGTVDWLEHGFSHIRRGAVLLLLRSHSCSCSGFARVRSAVLRRSPRRAAAATLRSAREGVGGAAGHAGVEGHLQGPARPQWGAADAAAAQVAARVDGGAAPRPLPPPLAPRAVS